MARLFLTVFISIFVVLSGFIDARPPVQHQLSDVKNYSGNATYYDPSIGACGFLSNGDELVCAIADSLYDTQTIDGNPNNNKFCRKQISVTGPKGTAIVTVVDRCGSCKDGDLDLSRPAFNKIGDSINGRVPVTWNFI
ncbi:unnamed protein product [Adineta ricciae]|uniref:RlpA-like protein double-psi beta-barrel domain-containing protein n=1 Tax=Adineta ricciae TaxID=249248 RepID=A0A815WNS9_ADIRI|nr:unnamed protein product [Adineta ricciae]CAF1545593.1 unnamed protein product [Adineta ricciae]